MDSASGSGRRSGYLASLTNLPPLIFRFQWNPDSLSESKSYTYKSVNSFGKWGIAAAGPSALSAVLSLADSVLTDARNTGALLTGARPLEAEEGGARVFSLSFALDADNPGPKDGDAHYGGIYKAAGGSILPDLALLRAFMNPTLTPLDIFRAIQKAPACPKTPPVCTLSYGGLRMDCVMTSLDISVTRFKPDGSPGRAEVSVSLQEQTFSYATIKDTIERLAGVGISYTRKGYAQDLQANLLDAVPLASMFL